MTKIALITGANRGLGRQTALDIARQGGDVIVTCRGNIEQAEAVVADIHALGRKAIALPLDMAQTASFPAFADSLGGDPFLRGVLVTGVARGSLAARIGVRPRDVIRRIDGREVASVSDLQRARAGSEVVILRGGRELTGRMPG